MIIARTSSGRAIAWVVGATVVTACSLEVNVHLDGSGDEGTTVEATVSVPTPPEAPAASEKVRSPETVIGPLGPLPPTPPVIRATPRGDAPVTDALWRPWESDRPVLPPPPAVESERDLSAAPTFTPFTVAPSILNRSEVVRAMVDEYPPLLREAGIGGTIRIYFFIEDDGTVGRTLVDQGSGHPALDEAAMAVADVYRFSPALNREEPVPVWVSFPITFQAR